MSPPQNGRDIFESGSPPENSVRRLKDAEDLRKWGKKMVDYIADYQGQISSRNVIPSISPGYLRDLIPSEAPCEAENWEAIFKDVDRCIMPGVMHWKHPQMHSYYTCTGSSPALIAEMLSGSIHSMGFSWTSCPASSELEGIVLDWLGKAIGLPEQFISTSSKCRGGGVIQSSASECVLVSLLSARHEAIGVLKQQQPLVEEAGLLSNLVAYASKEAHSSIEKAAKLGLIKLRMLETDEFFSLRGETLAKAIKDDLENGLTPFFVAASVGTTSCCSFDDLDQIGEICRRENIWLHVDASYAGCACICPEFQYLLKGIQYATTVNVSPYKWLLVNHACSVLWITDRLKLARALRVDPLYLKNNTSENSIEYRNWVIPLGRSFRALKLWFVMRRYGLHGLQSYIREHVHLAKIFECLVKADDRFEVVNEVHLGLVCFRLKGSNSQNERLLADITTSGKIHMVPCCLNERYVIRFCLCSEHVTKEDVLYAWNVIKQFALGFPEKGVQEKSKHIIC